VCVDWFVRVPYRLCVYRFSHVCGLVCVCVWISSYVWISLCVCLIECVCIDYLMFAWISLYVWISLGVCVDWFVCVPYLSCVCIHHLSIIKCGCINYRANVSTLCSACRSAAFLSLTRSHSCLRGCVCEACHRNQKGWCIN